MTKEPVVNIFITYDSKKAITVSEVDRYLYYVRQYNLEYPHAITYEMSIKGNNIKLKDVEQNTDGSKFAIGFYDDGIWYVRTFTKEQ